MRTCYYRIARHVVCIRFEGSGTDELLLPSYEPFKLDQIPEGEPILTTVTFNDSFSFAAKGKEIGQFDNGGYNQGLYFTEDGGLLFESFYGKDLLCSVMQTNADFSECHVALQTPERSARAYGANNSMMLAYAFAAADKQTLLFHASVIRKDGKGYLMTAPSGTGKSTHTFLWYKNIPDCDLMNDDNPVIRVVDGQTIVFGSPWSGKTPCYRNVEAPVGAIVRIRQHSANEIRPMKPVESFATLLSSVSSMRWDERVHHGVCETLGRVIELVPIYELGCLPNAEAAQLCYATVSR